MTTGDAAYQQFQERQTEKDRISAEKITKLNELATQRDQQQSSAVEAIRDAHQRRNAGPRHGITFRHDQIDNPNN